MDNQNFLYEDENPYPENISSKSKFRDLWSTIQTFFTFFAFSGLFAFFLPSGLSGDSYLILIMLGCGILSVIISCVVDIVKVALRISHIALAPMYIFAFIPLIVALWSIIIYIVVFALICGVCIAFPYITTLIAYIVKSIRAKKNGEGRKNRKIELLAALMGLIAAIALFAICNISHDVAVSKAPLLKEELNSSKQQLYNEYITAYSIDYAENIDFSNPLSTEFDENTMSQYDTYEFEQTVNGVTYNNEITIHYSHRNGKWHLLTITEEKSVDYATINVSDIFYGIGKYDGVIGIADFSYEFAINNLTQNGGKGSIKIHHYKTNQLTASGKCNINITEITEKESDIILNLSIVFDENLNGRVNNISGAYSVTSGDLKLIGFYSNDELILTTK